MQSSQPPLFAREDTFLGVCESLGEDFGFNAQYLRVALALLLFWNPVAAICGYLAAAPVLALLRWIYPNPLQPAKAPAAEATMQDDEELEAEPLPVAA